MDHIKEVWTQLLKSERSTRFSRPVKWITSPFWYTTVVVFKNLIYPLQKKEWKKKVRTFFGIPMMVHLPSGIDISLHGIKAHDSEIRLSKFLTRQLRPGQTFIDVGAHYGYYSLLASKMITAGGKVFAIEASQNSFKLLQENIRPYKNISIFQNAVSDHLGELTFFEYPGPYAEYNTTIEGLYVNAPWYKKIPETRTLVRTLVLDDFFLLHDIHQAVIKIDVEGGELAVLKGMKKSLGQLKLILILEYIISKDSGSLHHKAVNFLEENGFVPHRITKEGETEKITDIDHYLGANNLDSDNLVFINLAPKSPKGDFL